MALSVLRRADGLVTFGVRGEFEGGFTFGKKGFWFGGRGRRRT